MVPVVTMSIMTDPGRWVRLEAIMAIMAIMATMMGKLSHDWPGSPHYGSRQLALIDQNGLLRHDNLDITPCLQPQSSIVLIQNVTQKLRNGGHMAAG